MVPCRYVVDSTVICPFGGGFEGTSGHESHFGTDRRTEGLGVWLPWPHSWPCLSPPGQPIRRSDHRFRYRPAGGAERAGGRRGGAGDRRLALGAGRAAQRPAPAARLARDRRAHPKRRGRARRASGRRAARRWWCGAATAPAPSPMAAAKQMLDSCLKGPDALALSDRAGRSCPIAASRFKLPVSDANGRKLMARGRAVGGMAAVWLEEPAAASGVGRFPRHPGCAADSGLAARQGPGADLGQSRLPGIDRRRRHRGGARHPERRWTNPSATWRRRRRSPEQRAGSQALRGGGRPAPRPHLHRNSPGRCRHHRHRGGCDRRGGGRSAAAAACRCPCRHAGQAGDGGGDLRQATRSSPSTIAPSPGCGACRKTGWTAIPATAKSSTGCAKARKLPEQRDYQAWKRGRLALYQDARDRTAEEFWHMPGGQTMRVVSQPHPFGGLTFLYEDVSEKLDSGIQLQHPDQGSVRDPGHAAWKAWRCSVPMGG